MSLTPANLAPGDILLGYGSSDLALWVQCASNSCYHHAMLYAGREGSHEDAAFQAIPSREGVGIVSLGAFLSERHVDHLDVLRVSSAAGSVDAALAGARRRLRARYNRVVMPLFVMLYGAGCSRLGGVAADMGRRQLSESFKAFAECIRSALARQPRAQRPKKVKAMTCSQFVFECYRPFLDDVLELVRQDFPPESPLSDTAQLFSFLSRTEEGSGISGVDKAGDINALIRGYESGSRGADLPDVWRIELENIGTLLRVNSDVFDEEFLTIPMLLQADLLDLASFIAFRARGDDPSVALRGLPTEMAGDFAARFGPKDVAIARLRSRPELFVAPGHLSRSRAVVHVGRIFPPDA